MPDPNEPTTGTDEARIAPLFTIGRPPPGQWPDYPAEYGLTKADVPALVEVVQDEDLHYAPGDSNKVWAPLHAWRALAQLGAEEAVGGLLDALYLADEEFDDWMMEEMPDVLSMLGPGVLPELAAYLGNRENGLWSCVVTSHAVSRIGRQHPAVRDQAVAILAGQLAHHEVQDRYLNASLVADLTDLDAVEAEEVMAAAFGAGNVEFSVQGDWEEVQMALGLLDERLTPVPEKGWIPEIHDIVEEITKRQEMEAAREQIEKKMQQEKWGKVGRNEPCPCGSGKKYKRCHGRPG